MFGPALTLLAQLAATSPEGQVSPEALALELAEARATWSNALVRSDFREDAPAMRALAESMGPALLRAWRANGVPGDLRAQALELMEATAGDSLRDLVAARQALTPGLVSAWLRWHDDPRLAANLEPGLRLNAVRATATYHPHRALAPLLAWWEDSDVHTRDGVCSAALLLPTVERRRFVDAAMPRLRAVAPANNWPACIRLAVEHPEGRRWLAAAVRDNPPRPGDVEHWTPFAAALLVASGPTDAGTAASLARWTRYLSSEAEPQFRIAVYRALDRATPWWPATAPSRRAPVLALARAVGPDAVRLWPLRRALGDATLFHDAVQTLSSPSLRAPVGEALRVVGLTAPTDPRGRAEALAALDLLRSRLRPWSIDGVSPREIDRWRDAIDTVRPCAPGACAEALEVANDAQAARLLALGAPLTDPAVARVVVRRVVAAGEDFVTPDGAVSSPSALATVALSLVERCPPPLRGLALTRPSMGRPRGRSLDAWRERHAARCAAEARRP